MVRIYMWVFIFKIFREVDGEVSFIGRSSISIKR